MQEKSVERYQDFCASLEALRKAKGRDPQDEFVLSGTAQKYSMAFGLGWNVMNDLCIEYHGIPDFAMGSSKDMLRTAFSVGLISDDAWLDMLDIRNTLSHDYDGSLAEEYFHVTLEEYLPLMDEFRKKARNYYEE